MQSFSPVNGSTFGCAVKRLTRQRTIEIVPAFRLERMRIDLHRPRCFFERKKLTAEPAQRRVSRARRRRPQRLHRR